MREPKSILVIRLGGIGEIIAIIPALRAIRERFANSKITILASPRTYDVAKGSGLVDKVIVSDVFDVGGLRIFSPKNFAEFINLAEKILSTKYDLFLSFQHLFYWRSVWKPLSFGLLSRSHCRIGFNSFDRGFFLTGKVNDFRFEPRHLIYRNKDFLKLLGIDTISFDNILSVSDGDRNYISQLLFKVGIYSNKMLIGINPSSSRPSSRWPRDRFIELIKRIVEELQVNVVLISSKSDYDLCEDIKSNVGKGCFNLAGLTTIGGLYALMGKICLFISNDSGLIHIAYFLQVPTIGIFGPGEYPIWGTYENIDRFIPIFHFVWCAPCYRYKCSHHTCMKLIEVDDVYDAVAKILYKKNL